jgi:putative sterol carrier protein
MRGRRVVVGDRVRLAPAGGDEPARVVERLDRTTTLRRTGDDLDRHERVLVADADAAAVVVGADNLESGLRFADRVIVSATSGGLATVLVINKADVLVGVELTLDRGRCHKAVIVVGTEVGAAIVLTAPYQIWKAVVKGDLDPLAGVTRGKIAVKGSLATLMMHAKAATALVTCARAVPTEFPDEG